MCTPIKKKCLFNLKSTLALDIEQCFSAFYIQTPNFFSVSSLKQVKIKTSNQVGLYEKPKQFEKTSRWFLLEKEASLIKNHIDLDNEIPHPTWPLARGLWEISIPIQDKL